MRFVARIKTAYDMLQNVWPQDGGSSAKEIKTF